MTSPRHAGIKIVCGTGMIGSYAIAACVTILGLSALTKELNPSSLLSMMVAIVFIFFDVLVGWELLKDQKYNWIFIGIGSTAFFLSGYFGMQGEIFRDRILWEAIMWILAAKILLVLAIYLYFWEKERYELKQEGLESS